MNCKEVQELLGSAVDGELGTSEKGAFHTHVGMCPPCRKEYELEAMAKRLVTSGVPRVTTPALVRSSITRALRQEQETAPESISWMDRVMEKIFPLPAMAMGLAVLAMIYLVSPHPPSARFSTGEQNDVVVQTLNNFELIKTGSLKPAMTTADPESAIGFFGPHHLAFNVDVRKLTDCAAYGTMASDYKGVKLAHVVYTIGSDLVYVYEVKCAEVMNGTTLSLPKRIQARIKSGGWYVDEETPDRTLAVWDKEGTLCVATSTMKKEKMMALLATR